MTSLPASVYQLKGKGLIRPGMDADLVLFDPHTVSDQADFTDFSKRGTGIELVWIRGEKIVEHGIYNGVKAGKLIRHVPHISYFHTFFTDNTIFQHLFPLSYKA